jgi:hypothetical protein
MRRLAHNRGIEACIEKRNRGRLAMLGILAGLIAFFGMSICVVVGAGVLYDPDRSYQHH